MASGSLFTKIGRGFSEWLDLGLIEGELPAFHGAQADGCAPVATAYADGHDVCRPVKPDTIAKSLAIGNAGRRPLRARPGAQHRRLDRGRQRRRDPRRHPAARRDDGHLHRDRRRRDHGDARQARRGRRDRQHDDRVVLFITGDGLKTLDAVRDGLRDARDRADPRLVRGRRRRSPAGGRLTPPQRKRALLASPATRNRRTSTNANHGQDPRAAPTRHRRRGRDRGRIGWAATVGDVLDAVFAQHDGLRERITEDGDLRRFVNVYVSGEDIRFQDGLETSVCRRRRGHDPARGRRRV